MFNFFKNIASALIILGIILFTISFFISISFWFGIALINSGVYLFIIGLFAQLMERDLPHEQI